MNVIGSVACLPILSGVSLENPLQSMLGGDQIQTQITLAPQSGVNLSSHEIWLDGFVVLRNLSYGGMEMMGNISLPIDNLSLDTDTHVLFVNFSTLPGSHAFLTQPFFLPLAHLRTCRLLLFLVCCFQNCFDGDLNRKTLFPLTNSFVF